MDIGARIRELRNDKKITLRELSEKTKLSTGYLSQLERGLTTIATDSLEDIAIALGADLSYFFVPTESKNDIVIRSYEKSVFQIESDKFIHYNLSGNTEDKHMLPKIVLIMPGCNRNKEELKEFRHKGEEFLYVLKGILTVFIDKEKYELHEGDSIHFDSAIAHNWCNGANNVVKVLVIGTPNPFMIKKMKKNKFNI
ncbi:helix-turn-helix domain-containing protein [Anaerosalibacter massiliensis]|uniref:XRE family transcriptional regulator n=1 Tax=Anaerosalibacter massiliensis TaxID=1347392 RepID=A0A9X2MH54_9FIRM|nr:XRE family transcriptional regulator [Anaerosalibacter massiliensis]MCR2043925.1 XRE family transcriptional regulator [Anaerosalibacter massiliensis]